MNEKELNYLLTNFACDHIDELVKWLRDKDCDTEFVKTVVDDALKLSINNAKKQSEMSIKLLKEVSERFS